MSRVDIFIISFLIIMILMCILNLLFKNRKGKFKMKIENKIKMKHFLDELTYLTEKYNVIIEGCGCCGSPYLIDKNENDIGYDLKYINNKYEYKEIRGVKNDKEI